MCAARSKGDRLCELSAGACQRQGLKAGSWPADSLHSKRGSGPQGQTPVPLHGCLNHRHRQLDMQTTTLAITHIQGRVMPQHHPLDDRQSQPGAIGLAARGVQTGKRF